MIARARFRCLVRWRGRGAAAGGRLTLLEVAADEADERVYLLLVEPVLEAGHAFAAVLNLLHQLGVRVLDRVRVAEVGDFQRRPVVEFDRAARAVLLVAAGARVLEGRVRVGQLVGRGSRRGRGGGGT